MSIPALTALIWALCAKHPQREICFEKLVNCSIQRDYVVTQTQLLTQCAPKLEQTHETN